MWQNIVILLLGMIVCIFVVYLIKEKKKTAVKKEMQDEPKEKKIERERRRARFVADFRKYYSNFGFYPDDNILQGIHIFYRIGFFENAKNKQSFIWSHIPEKLPSKSDFEKNVLDVTLRVLQDCPINSLKWEAFSCVSYIVFSVKKDEISTIFNEQRRYFSIEQGKEFRFDYSVYVFDLLNAFCEKCLEEKGKERRAAELKRNLFVMKQNGYAFCKKIFEIEEY